MTKFNGVFIAAFVIQRVIELVDPLFERSEHLKAWKKFYFGLIGFGLGLLLASLSATFRLLTLLEIPSSTFLDVLVSALALSAGTDALNALLKLLSYKRDAARSRARVETARVLRDCHDCVRGVVEEWAGVEVEQDGQVLGDLYVSGGHAACDDGSMLRLKGMIEKACRPCPSLAGRCKLDVAGLLVLVCGR